MSRLQKEIAEEITNGGAVLGLEFGSTRIKAVLIDSYNEPVASGAFDWENTLSDGIWTYPHEEIMRGLSLCYAALKDDVKKRYGVTLTSLKAMGISAMMHGYLAFDKNGSQLVPFRTWRNTMTLEASKSLSDAFQYPVPERWSISHLYHAVTHSEPHVPDISFFTTLAGYIHWRLTNQKVIGIGDASGMFPVDTVTHMYDRTMMRTFDEMVCAYHVPWKIESLLPRILCAGENAGTLTADGVRLLDADGDLQPGIPLCPPEGDAGTGMTATNSILPRTGNVSAGTSVFAMVVLEKPLNCTYSGKIDLVATPAGDLTAMAHANNCTGEYDNWIRVFGEALSACGCTVSKGALYESLLSTALTGDKNCGGLVPYNYISGESMTGISEGRPLFVRTQHASFTLANFMRAQLFTALGALRTGMDILFDKENVKIDRLTGHGGFFKTARVGLAVMAAALHTPVSVLATAGEGGPWGMALLASYMVNGGGRSLSEFLDSSVFAHSSAETATPEEDDIKGFNEFFAAYTKGLAVEKAAVEAL